MIDIIKRFFSKKENTQVSIEEKFEEIFNSLNLDIIKLEIGNDCSDFTNEILEEIDTVRNNIKTKTGFILPQIHVLSSEELQENEIIFTIRSKYIIQDFVIPNEENIRKSIKENLEKIYNDYLEEIFSIELVEKYINQVQKNNCWLVWCITKQIGTTEIKKILVNIIKNKKSIHNINYIFEKIDECISEDRDYFRTWKPEIISNKICKEI